MEAFYTKGGKEVSTLNEMADALEAMPDDEYAHHVTPQRNDIAIWVEDIHKNESLAKAISQAKDKSVVINLLRELGAASFPNNEEYHPANSAGKEDADLHETYNKPEEWQAAKEAAHPDEEVENPAGNNLAKIAAEQNEEVKEPAAIDTPAEAPAETPEINNEVSPENNPEISAENLSPETIPEASQKEELPTEVKAPEHPATSPNFAAHDLNPGEHTMKDKLIFGIAGLILGIIIGYLIAWLLG